MNIVRLHTAAGPNYVSMRRSNEPRTKSAWLRDARTRRIPGAFQFDGKGPWYVDLDTHDEEVRVIASNYSQAKKWVGEVPEHPSDSIQELARSLGLSDKELAVAVRSARN